MQFLGIIVFVCVSNPWTLLITLPVIVAAILLRHYSVKTIMEVKRIEAACKYEFILQTRLHCTNTLAYC